MLLFLSVHRLKISVYKTGELLERYTISTPINAQTVISKVVTGSKFSGFSNAKIDFG